MDLTHARRSLEGLILDGLIAGEKRARSELKLETLYAVTLYAASGFRALGVAVNTREALERARNRLRGVRADLLETLKDHPDLLATVGASSEPDPEACAWEWEYLYSDLPHEDAGTLIDNLYDYFYDSDYTPDTISDWFLTTVSQSLQNFATLLPNDRDLLLGLQFSDPDANESRMMERVSELVNSSFWHAKVVVACNDLRGSS
jgi:hypothetical protein